MDTTDSTVSYIGTDELMKYLALPPEVKAVLEWTTGLMRINCSSDEYESFADGADGWDDFYESLVHETFHLYQICTSGFLYAFLTEVAFNIIEELQLDSVPVDEAFTATHQPSDVLRILLSALSAPEEEISIVDLIEGAAFLGHHKICYENLDAAFYDHILQLDCNLLYSRSYRYLSAIFEDHAFALLNPITSFALQFSRPVDAFKNAIVLLQGLQVDPTESDFAGAAWQYLSGKMQEIANNDNPNIPSPISVSGSFEYSPFYLSTFKALQDSNLRGLIDTIVMDPSYHHRDVFLDLSRPIMFNDGVVYIPDDFSSDIFESDQEHSEAMTVYAALSLKYLSFSNVLNLYKTSKGESHG